MAIRPDTDPKSASQRSGTSNGELEQYGVWVKAEPQDVIEEISVPASDDMDFTIPGDSTSLTEESFLSEDEEKLLGTFDAEPVAASSSPVEVDVQGPLPDIEDMPSLDESVLSSEPSPATLESGSVDIDLEDIESYSPASAEKSVSDAEPGVLEEFEPQLEPVEPSTGSIEDVSSEFLDMGESLESGPDGASSSGPGFDAGLDDVTSEFLDVEQEISVPKEAPPSADFEPLDIDLQFDDTLDSSKLGAPASPSEAGFEAVTEFDDFLSVDESKASSTAAGGFDDVAALERDLAAPSPESAAAVEFRAAPSARPSQAPEGKDLSTELLLKIANELSSIRGELVSLKTQIGEVMEAATAEAPQAKAPAAEDEESVAPPPSGGFFDEEEDETIALTGDELDNILNTADFTEEVAVTEQLVDLDIEGMSPEMPSSENAELLSETLLPESGDYAAVAPSIEEAEPAIEEVNMGESDIVDEAAIMPAATDFGNLSFVAEQGVTPMTEAPEDTSYLESPDIGAPLKDEPLVEPDLSDFDLETEDLESKLEIDEELPLASFESESEPSTDTLESLGEDITLDIDAGPGYAAEDNSVEAELLEPVQDEIEEPNFAEINLHEEELVAPSSEMSESIESAELEEIGFEPEPSAAIEPEPQAVLAQEYPIEEEEDLIIAAAEEEPAPAPLAAPAPSSADDGDRLKSEIKSILSYLDKLLDSLPEEKIEEFARSEYFDTYKKLFEELGLV